MGRCCQGVEDVLRGKVAAPEAVVSQAVSPKSFFLGTVGDCLFKLPNDGRRSLGWASEGCSEGES